MFLLPRKITVLEKISAWFSYQVNRIHVTLMEKHIKGRLKDKNIDPAEITSIAVYFVARDIKPYDLNVEFFVSYSLQYNLAAFSTTYIQRKNKPQSCVLLVKRYSETHTSTVALCGLAQIKEYFLNDAHDKEGDVFFFY